MAAATPPALPLVSIEAYETQLKRDMYKVAKGEVEFTPVLNSPRSLAACLRVGLSQDDLKPLARKTFDQRHPLPVKLPAPATGALLPGSPKKEGTSAAPLPPPLPPPLLVEAQDKMYKHYQARLFEKVELVKHERRNMIMKQRGEEGYHFLLYDYEDDAHATPTTPTATARAGAMASPDPAALAVALARASFSASPAAQARRSSPSVAGGEDVEERVAHLKSSMMEMEARRIEAVKKRQEREFVRLMEGEKKMIQLQQKLQAAEEEAAKKKQAHEKQVEQHRKAEVEKKKQRLHELQRQKEEEQERKKEIARKDAALKAQLAAEARAAERSRRKHAEAREKERAAKLDTLRQRTEGILQEQEELAEKHRILIETREARVKAQVDAKKQAKAAEIQAARAKAEKRIQETLLKNQALQQEKRAVYEARAQEHLTRAQQQHAAMLEAAHKAAEARRQKQARRDQRLQDATQGLQQKIQRTLTRAEERSSFYSEVAAQQEQVMLLAKLDKELRHKDKLDNVKRIQCKEAFERECLLAKQQADTARYEAIKAERAYLLEQRKQTAQHVLLRKHKLKEAMETMKITNKFSEELIGILGGGGGQGGKEKERASSTGPHGGRGDGSEGRGRPQSLPML